MSKRSVDQEAEAYRPVRGKFGEPRDTASSVMRAVQNGGEIQPDTLTELLELLRTKTDYHFHIEVAIQPTGSALLKTIDNERDAKETIRRLRTKT